MAKRIATFRIESPPDTSAVGTSFNVSGVCPALAGSDPPSITVKIFDDSGAEIATSDAETDPPNTAFEAAFTNVPAGLDRQLKAFATTGMPETAPVTNITVEDPERTIQFEVSASSRRRPAGSTRKPAAQKPAKRKPAAKKPAARKPAARKPAARKPAAQKRSKKR